MNFNIQEIAIHEHLLLKEPKTFFTSDCHFLHKRIVDITDRPVTIEDHDQWLINQINSVVDVDDTVYHLGDFCFGKTNDIKKLLSQLNGKWIFIVGNHDNKNSLNEACKNTQHKVVGTYYEIKLENKTIVLCHYPFRTWNKSHYGSLNLHGHCHGNSTKRNFKYKFLNDLAKRFKFDHRKANKNQMDVGIDATGTFKPIEIKEIIHRMKNN